jgi:hypothetical protein
MCVKMWESALCVGERERVCVACIIFKAIDVCVCERERERWWVDTRNNGQMTVTRQVEELGHETGRTVFASSKLLLVNNSTN